MTTRANNDLGDEFPESVRAEAAVWVARLHSDLRSAETERAFRAWFAADPVHAAAFERMTQTWEATRGCLASAASERPLGSRTSRPRLRRALPALAASLVALAAVGVWMLRPATHLGNAQIVETDPGERRSRVLPDGSRVILNTDSRISVLFDSKERRLVLERGQARFDVAHSPGRPFIVIAGDKQIVATGTAFDVRWTDTQLSVVLFEGRVQVLSRGKSADETGARPVTLEPGQRAQFHRRTVTIRSVQALDREEAWLEGRAVFERTRLSDAIGEMNRYTRRRLEFTDSRVGELRISGTFSVDDVDAFARSLVDLFPLSVEFSDERIVVRPTND